MNHKNSLFSNLEILTTSSKYDIIQNLKSSVKIHLKPQWVLSLRDRQFVMWQSLEILNLFNALTLK